MELVIVPACSLPAAALMLFSGFGLGSLLMPAGALFFPFNIKKVRLIYRLDLDVLQRRSSLAR